VKFSRRSDALPLWLIRVSTKLISPGWSWKSKPLKVLRYSLEPAIADLNGVAGHQPRFTAPHQKRSILDWQALSQIGIVRKNGAAITDRKNGGDQLQAIFLADPLYFIEATKVLGGLLAERIKAEGNDSPVESVLAGGLEDA